MAAQRRDPAVSGNAIAVRQIVGGMTPARDSMVAVPEHSDAVRADPLDVILSEALREFNALEAKLAQLGDRVLSILVETEQGRGSLQQFIDAFALEQQIQYPNSTQPDQTSAPLFDVDHIQRERSGLDRQVVRSKALRTNIETALHVLRSCRDQLTDERAYQLAEDADSVRLQQAMNIAREEERRRLAREIHDGPAQVLANAIFVVGIAEQVVKREPDKVIEQLGDMKALLKDGVAEIRRFMFDLRPSMLEDQGLVPTLRYYVGEYNRMFAKRVELELDEPLPPLSIDQELCVFRIAQEALHNIQKHAETDDAQVILSREYGHDSSERTLWLIVTDRGRGFNPDLAVPRHGHGAGLPGMRERARLIGADLTIESGANEGTTVRLRIPLRPLAESDEAIGSDLVEKGGAR